MIFETETKDNTFSSKLFSKLLLNWTQEQKTTLYGQLIFIDVIWYMLWLVAMIIVPGSKTVLHLEVLEKLLLYSTIWLFAVIVMMLWVLFKPKLAKQYNVWIQTFFMLMYSLYFLCLGYYFGQFNFISGVTLGAGTFWALLLLKRQIAYAYFILNVAILFLTVMVTNFLNLTYASAYINLVVTNSTFWIMSSVYLGIIKICLIMLLGDAIINIYKDRFKKLSYISKHDGLTNLYNRRYIHTLMYEQVQKKNILSIVIIDIDFFKKINDKFGHLAGDKIICDISTIIENHFGEAHDICRYGGEEFLIMLKDLDIATSKNKLESLLEKIRNTQFTDDKNNIINVTISAGLASSLDYSELLSDNDLNEKSINGFKNKLIKQADDALLFAKKNGRDQLVTAKLVNSVN